MLLGLGGQPGGVTGTAEAHDDEVVAEVGEGVQHDGEAGGLPGGAVVVAGREPAGRPAAEGDEPVAGLRRRRR